MGTLEKADILIRHQNGKFIAGIPQVGLYAKGEDPISALAALEEQRKSLPSDIEDTIELFDSGKRGPAVASQRGNWKIGLFVLKLVLVIFLAGGASLYIGNTLAARLNQTIDKARSAFNEQRVSGDVKQAIARAAEYTRKAPEAEKRKLLGDLTTIVDFWRPLVRETMSVFSDSSPPPSDKPDGQSGAK